MILPPFDYTRQHWDRYNEFHISHDGKFTQFERGEFIIYSSFRRVRDRRTYHEFGFDIFTARNLPWTLRGKTFYNPRTESVVKRSWLDTNQMLLYDHSSKRIVALGTHHDSNRFSINVPSRLMHCCQCYFAGVGRLPQGGAPVIYNRQDVIPAELRKEVAERLVVIKTQERLAGVTGGDPGSWAHGDNRVLYTWLMAPAMTDSIKHLIARYGIKAGTTPIQAVYLDVRDS